MENEVKPVEYMNRNLSSFHVTTHMEKKCIFHINCKTMDMSNTILSN